MRASSWRPSAEPYSLRALPACACGQLACVRCSPGAGLHRQGSQLTAHICCSAGADVPEEEPEPEAGAQKCTKGGRPAAAGVLAAGQHVLSAGSRVAAWWRAC